MPASWAARVLLDRFDRSDATAVKVLRAVLDRADFGAEPSGDVRSAGRDPAGWGREALTEARGPLPE
jgi:hypothetical protein